MVDFSKLSEGFKDLISGKNPGSEEDKGKFRSQKPDDKDEDDNDDDDDDDEDD